MATKRSEQDSSEVAAFYLPRSTIEFHFGEVQWTDLACAVSWLSNVILSIVSHPLMVS